MRKEENFLDMIPVRLHENYKEIDGKVFLLFTYDNIVQKFLRWLVKKGDTSTLELDELGSVAWNTFDGKNNVHRVIEILLERDEKDTYESMEKRIILFIRLFLRKKLIKLERR